jgi:D-3-phosphoglycerate dehydrogenase
MFKGFLVLTYYPAKRASWSPDENPIFTLPNVIVTPHAAYYSEESIQMARETAADEVASVLLGKNPNYPINAAALAATQK